MRYRVYARNDGGRWRAVGSDDSGALIQVVNLIHAYHWDERADAEAAASKMRRRAGDAWDFEVRP